MKILGSDNDGNRIVSCSVDELANIVGEYYGRCKAFKPGSTINVSGIYQKYHELINNSSTVESIKKGCEAILSSLSIINPLVEEQNKTWSNVNKAQEVVKKTKEKMGESE